MANLSGKPDKLTAKELAQILGCKKVNLGSYVVFLEW
jgi:hypothetical protein